MSDVDVVVIGAGPAGLAAASRCAEAGANTLLLDEQETPGGQIYRAVENTSAAVGELLGADYLAGNAAIRRMRHSGCDYRPGATIWKVESNGQVVYTVNHCAKTVAARFVIVATGALERPMPIPGWTLPGVMSVGAAQILLKSAATVTENAVLAGSGPLLYLLATQLVRAGCPPRALIETQTRSDYLRAARHVPGALRTMRTLLKGRRWLGELRRAGVQRYTGAADLRIAGTDAAEAIEFRLRGTTRRIDASTILLHQGVVPNTQITRSMSLDHHWHEGQRCFVPTLDERGASSSDSIRVAGDGAAIVGAVASALFGERTAIHCVAELGLVAPALHDQSMKKLSQAIQRELAVRPFLDALYMPPAVEQQVTEETIVCRCEEVRVRDIRRYAEAGCIGPNQTKAFGRCGMGPCQGRYCALTVTQLLASFNQLSPDEVGSYRIRSPLKPVTLAELASLHDPIDSSN